MKINITKKEYAKLLDVFYIADWIMHAFTIGDREETEEYMDLEQKIFMHAKDFGFDDLVMQDHRNKLFYPTRKFEDESPAMKFIKEFEEESFWDELIYRLAIKDLVEKHGPDVLKSVFEDEDIFKSIRKYKFFLIDLSATKASACAKGLA